MGKSIAVWLAVCVIAAQSASFGNGESQHEREKRSCGYCQGQQAILPPLLPPPGPPPPPPLVFHTHHYSGYARSPDGRQQGVFTGAAAQASSANDDVQASGQAFSLNDAGTSLTDLGRQTQSAGYGGKSYFRESQSAYGGKSFDSHSGAQGGYNGSGSQGSFGNQEQQQQQPIQNGIQGFGQQKQQEFEHGSHRDFGKQGSQQQNQGFISASAEAQSSSNGFSGRGDQGQVEQFGKYKSGSLSGSPGRGDQGDVEKFGKYNSGGNAGSFGDQVQEQQQVQTFGKGGSGANGYGADGNSQGALHGALELASQGLQTAQQTSSGCSTCGKSSYALSNAKSHSGSAVAVSIGG